MSLKPLHDRVLVQRLEGEEKTKGGIIIPDTAKEKPMQAKVVAVGPGKGKAKMTVKKGDMVLIGKYAGNEFKVDGKELVILREEDILAVIEK
ncbi:co-chaperone GroES [Desulfovibrio aminophilus]|nr:co-chaperone GroES [Desulfovibrio aminophilus]MCM0755957.1 co-chaperone GroES [Desulfovibrio aminophilus]